MQERVLFRRIHGQVILTRAARIDEFQNNVFADAFQVPPPPGFPRISARRAAALFHRPVVRAARGVRFHFIRRAPHDVHAAAIGLPSRDAGSIVFVGVSNPAVMLFLKVVLWKVGIAAAPQPELLDELLALFVGIQLQESIALVGRDNVSDVFRQPLPVGTVQLLQRPLHFPLCYLVQLLEYWRSSRILRLLGGNRWNSDSHQKNRNEQGPYYP